jgi:hypothetical protein
MINLGSPLFLLNDLGENHGPSIARVGQESVISQSPSNTQQTAIPTGLKALQERPHIIQISE